MEFLYLTETPEGMSYFEDKSVYLTMGDFAPPAPQMWMSQKLASSNCLFLTLPAGWGGAKHPSPHRQVGLCLAGRLRVEAGNGEIREFGAGAIWWMDDTDGSGHTTTVISDEDVKLAIVQLACDMPW